MFKAYDTPNHLLSPGDIGACVVVIVELRCLDVGHGLASFTRVRGSPFF